MGKVPKESMSCLPGGLKWGDCGLKILGIYLGSETTLAKNMEGGLRKVEAKLSRWKWLLSQQGKGQLWCGCFEEPLFEYSFLLATVLTSETLVFSWQQG